MKALATTLLLATTALLTTACTDTAQIATLPEIDFTGVGKPTEAVTTEYGTFNISDPRQDPELITMAETLWKTDSRPDQDELRRLSLIISTAHELRITDCLRAGGYTSPHGRRYILETSIPKHCENPSFGETMITSCEREHARFEQIWPIEAYSASYESGPFIFISATFNGDPFTFDQALDAVYKSTCR